MPIEPIDLVLLKQAGQVVAQPVLDALEQQGRVSLNTIVVTGDRLSQDHNRWDAICRARNRAKSCASASKVMFLDSDVVLPEGAIERLAIALDRDPKLAAAAADYLGEAGRWSVAHVGMGATLFRRDILSRITFRWEAHKCECLCCCEDLRKLGWRIEYFPGLRAQHLRSASAHGREGLTFDPSPVPPAVHVCSTCGTQYLVPAPCCGNPTAEKPLLFYSFAQSPHPFEEVEFSIVMLTKNNLELTRTAAESLLRDCPTDRTEFIFVDSGSTDRTLAYLQELALRCQVKLTVTHPHEPFIYGRNNNRGASAAVGEYLLLVNNDIEVLSERPYDLLRKALSNRKAGAAGILWTSEWHKFHSEQIAREMRDGYWLGVLPVPGYFWAMRREVYWEVGGMDEEFSGYGHDEVEMQYRLVKANYLVALLNAQVRHEQGATYLRQTPPEEGKRMWEGNVARFHQKHGTWPFFSETRMDPFTSHKLPVISVAISARNYGSFLRRCLDSVLACRNPTDAPLQIVVVDHASTDETPLILFEYKQRHPETFNLIRLETQSSAANGKNTAIDRCIGKYIALLDADDEFLPDKLEVCYRALEETGCDLVYHDFFVHTPDHPALLRARGIFAEPSLRDVRQPSAWMFRNGAVRFNEQMVGGAEDLEWFLRVWESLRTVHIPRPLFIYHGHPGQQSQTAGHLAPVEQMLAPIRRLSGGP